MPLQPIAELDGMETSCLVPVVAVVLFRAGAGGIAAAMRCSLDRAAAHGSSRAGSERTTTAVAGGSGKRLRNRGANRL